MAFDFKKEYRELYKPRRTPSVVRVPSMSFVAVRGIGDPNEEGGSYQQALSVLYGVSFAIKMAPRSGHDLEGYFAYVVPPLEGFWRRRGAEGFVPADKAGLEWVSCIRLPDFVDRAAFDWAVAEAGRKKGADLSAAEFLTVEEGLCVQCLHVGSYDDEPATVEAMHAFAARRGLVPDFSDVRLHHEIYLSDPRRTAPERLRTVVRHPVRKA